MGSFLATFHNYEQGIAQDVTNPSRSDWISVHAEMTGLSMVEAERMWKRFQQLGCDSRGDGSLAMSTVRQSQQLTIFVRNILGTLAVDGKIFFQTFLNVMKWADESRGKVKYEAVFEQLNQGKSLTLPLMKRVLGRLYADMEQEDTDRRADILFKAMDVRNTGEISIEDWLQFENDLPKGALNKLLDLDIIPDEINEEAHKSFSVLTRSETKFSHQRQTHDKAVVSELSLLHVAERACASPWEKLVKALGVEDEERKRVAQEHNSEKDQLFILLRTWWLTEGTKATCGSLRTALTANGFSEDVIVLVHGSAKRE